MSDLLVNVVRIDSIEPHPNADRLEIIKVGGWQIVSGKGNYVVGDLAVHIPPDAMVPRQFADQWEVTQYLSFGKNSPDMGRVRAARLRGIVSYGFLAPNDTNAILGTDLATHYGVAKYEPPPPPVGMQAGQMARNHPLFHTYTDIQNLRNYPDKLDYSLPLVVTEKVHGTNSCVGWIRVDHDDGKSELEIAVGTHRTQRKPEDCGLYGLPLEKYHAAIHSVLTWFLLNFQEQIDSLILFGEIYGAGVQDLHYGAKQEKDWRVFDIAINGKYLDWTTLEFFGQEHGLPLVPILERGCFDFNQLIALAQGNTAFTDTHIREGVVVRPMLIERTWGRGEFDPQPKRMIFKIINDEYLLRKGGSEHH